jgi:hypothetical protein
MAHCFRWKIILPPAKRLDIDSASTRCMSGMQSVSGSQHSTSRRTQTSGSCWLRRPRSSCVAAGMRLKTRQRQLPIGGGRYLNSPSPDGTPRPTLESAHQRVASFFRPGSA